MWQHFVVKKAKQSTIEVAGGDVWWAYRGPYRRKDSIGLFISDEDYDEDMEGLTVEELAEAYPEVQLPTKDMALLMRLQWAHDCAANNDREFRKKVRARLEEIAQEFNLEIKQ